MKTPLVEPRNSSLQTDRANNPEGTQRRYHDNPGDIDRVGNLSGRHSTWWDNVPGEDVLTWNPVVNGTFEHWLSWGAHGSNILDSALSIRRPVRARLQSLDTFRSGDVYW